MQRAPSLGIIALALAMAGQSAGAQRYEPMSVEMLYERGQREMTAGWHPLGKTANAAVFIHDDVRNAGGGRLAVWTDRELPAVEYFDKEKSYLSTRERWLVDCKGMRIGTSDTNYYGGRFGKGDIVASTVAAAPEMSNLVPDSVEYQLAKKICAPKPRPHRKAPTKTDAASPVTKAETAGAASKQDAAKPSAKAGSARPPAKTTDTKQPEK